MLKLAIVSPCFNEEAVLERSAGRLTALLDELTGKGKVSPESFIMFVNDGSSDRTWQIISDLHGRDGRIKGICLAHNSGHQNAIMAGMMAVRGICDGVVTIDADLQDEMACIEQMVDKNAEGADVVYGVKVERSADSAFKRKTAEMFYHLMEKMGVESVYNHADFRFVSARVLDALAEFPETNLYLRALIKRIGFPYATVEDHLGVREAGDSKYTLSKMLGLAVNGITSFTEKPLYYVIYAGLMFMLISILVLLYVVISLIAGHVVAGWTSLMLSVWFIGGALMLAIGVTGIYIGKIFHEVKHRPRYIIQERLD